MVVLDANGLIALLADEPAADAVERLLRDESTAMTAVNVAEAVDKLARKLAVSPERARPAIETVTGDSLAILGVTPELGFRAGAIRARHYRRRDRAISLVDAVLVAAAREGDSIATSDRQVIAIAELEGIATIRLPDSTGQLSS